MKTNFVRPKMPPLFRHDGPSKGQHKVMRVLTAVAAGFASTSISMGVLGMYNPAEPVLYWLALSSCLLPVAIVMSFKVGGWKRWYRFIAVSIWLLATVPLFVPLAMILSVAWIWYRVLWADGLVWRKRAV